MNYIVMLIGFLSGALAIFFYTRTQKLLKEGETTMGEVVEVREGVNESTDDEGYTSTSVTYYPTISFQTKDGNSIDYESKVGSSNSKKYTRGMKMEVVYDPSDPKKVKIKSFGQLWFSTIVSGLIAVVLILIGLIMVFV